MELPSEKEPRDPGTSLEPTGNSGYLPGTPPEPLAPPTLLPVHKKSHLNKCTAPEALNCCIRIFSLERATPMGPGTAQTALRPPWGVPRELTRQTRCHVFFEITHMAQEWDRPMELKNERPLVLKPSS